MTGYELLEKLMDLPDYMKRKEITAWDGIWADSIPIEDLVIVEEDDIAYIRLAPLDKDE